MIVPLRWLIALTALLCGYTGSAFAQAWPTRAIHVIVPFTAGSGSDIVTRTIMDQLSRQLGQPIVVENRVGAGGTIGNNMVAKADPDGYTILAASSGYSSVPFIYKSMPYVLTDLAAVTPLANLPQVLVIAPSKNIKTVSELVAAAKANPGKMSYASGGVGSATHLSVEKFRLSAGFQGIHVPFKGGPEALTEVMTGRVDFYFVPTLPALPLIADNRLLPVAVSSTQRAAVLPNVPTTLEAGYANSDYNFWVGLLVPAKTPREIISKLHAETVKAIRSPEVAAKLPKFGADPIVMSPPEFEAYLKAELVADEKHAKATGLAGIEN
jgi:tripartite-type tricarboxylate transporter receptor subunit TctC